jgi:hypothetical protein
MKYGFMEIVVARNAHLIPGTCFSRLHIEVCVW